MSLITEALRKARQQAIDRGDREIGPAAPPTVIRVRPRSPLGTGLVIGAAIAVAAGLAGAAMVWWALGGGSNEAPATSAVVEEATEPGARPRPSGPVPSDTVVGAVGSNQPVSTPSSAARGAGEPEPQAAAGRATHDGRPVEPEGDHGSGSRWEVDSELDRVTVTPSAPGGSAVTTDQGDGERMFVLDADLGYATLNLGFIIYRSEDPFAEINGSEVHEGTEIEGFVVERIERDRVLLRDDRGPLVLRAH